MHIISYRRLREFSQKHAACCAALDAWFKIALKANWSSFTAVQSVFPTVETMDHFVIFSLHGNYRLLSTIDYAAQLIQIKYVLTQTDYVQEQWQHDAPFQPR